MSFRQVIVKKAEILKFKDSCLLVEDERSLKIPIEDIAIIVIENNRCMISIKVINKCSENHIALITCDDRKLPSSMLIPFSGHYRQLENTYLQIKQKNVDKQNLWRSVIYMKIQNQINVIKLTTRNERTILKMQELRNNIKRNDSTNREALAARIFFQELYGSDFKRFIDDKINGVLNYGYSIIVSSIARQLVSYGLDPKFGIWHSSKSNSLNLAYDLVEPFRALIDYYIYSNYEFITEELNPGTRRDLIALLNANVEVNNQKYRLQNAIEEYVKRFLLIIRLEEKEMLNIKIIKTNFYEIK